MFYKAIPGFQSPSLIVQPHAVQFQSTRWFCFPTHETCREVKFSLAIKRRLCPGCIHRRHKVGVQNEAPCFVLKCFKRTLNYRWMIQEICRMLSNKCPLQLCRSMPRAVQSDVIDCILKLCPVLKK